MKFLIKIFSLCLLFLLSVRCLIADNQNDIEKKNQKNIDIENSASFSENLKKLEIPEQYQLNEIIIGNPNAPSTVIVYSSFTCNHCRDFHINEFPKFKKKYVNTGKIKVYLRSYIDDLGALESAQLMRCIGKKSTKTIENIYHEIFLQQRMWLKSKDPRNFLKNIFVKQGHEIKTIDACLKSKDIPAGLMKEQQRAMHEYHITSVPAFIVNGKIHSGKLTAEELEKMF